MVFGSVDPLGRFITLPEYTKAELDQLLRPLVTENSTNVGTGHLLLGTVWHEATHFLQLAGTTFGHFWTRALYAQGAFAARVLRGRTPLFSATPNPRLKLPLAENWPAVVPKEAGVALLGLSLAWLQIDAFLASLLGTHISRIQEVIKLGSKVLPLWLEYGYLDRKNAADSRISVQLSTNQSPDTPTSPGGKAYNLSTIALTELQALLAEQLVLMNLGSTRDPENLHRRADAGGFALPLQLLAMHHGSGHFYSEEYMWTLSALIDLALFAELDPFLVSIWSSHLLWEDIHPAYRYMSACKFSERLGLLDNLSHFEEYQDQICKMAGWLRPREILSKLLPALEQSASTYDQLNAACCRAHLTAPSRLALAHPGSDLGLGSPIVVCKDGILMLETPLGPRQQTERHAYLAVKVYLRREITRQLLFEPKLADLNILKFIGFDLSRFMFEHLAIQPEWLVTAT